MLIHLDGDHAPVLSGILIMGLSSVMSTYWCIQVLDMLCLSVVVSLPVVVGCGDDTLLLLGLCSGGSLWEVLGPET